MKLIQMSFCFYLIQLVITQEINDSSKEEAEESLIQDNISKEIEKEFNKYPDEPDNKSKQTAQADEDERKGLMKEWEDLMQNFIPDDMISFDIKSGSIEILEHTIDKSTLVRGAYFINIYSKDKIDFIIKDPWGHIVTSKAGKKEAVFAFNTTIEGDYKFIFSNKRGKELQSVTFALDIKDSKDEHLQYQTLNEVDYQIQSLHDGVTDIFFETKFSQLRQESGYESLKSTHNNILWFTVFETIAIIGVTLWQLYYLKRLADSRLLL